MSNEEIIDELLHEAEKFRVREEVLESARVLLDKNPKMERVDAVKLALDNIKLHSGLNRLK
jgi:hypothetical protein